MMTAPVVASVQPSAWAASVAGCSLGSAMACLVGLLLFCHCERSDAISGRRSLQLTPARRSIIRSRHADPPPPRLLRGRAAFHAAGAGAASDVPDVGADDHQRERRP